MKARLGTLSRLLRWRGPRRTGTTGYWNVEQLVSGPNSVWPHEPEALAGEMQFSADHFALADAPAGAVCTTHVLAEEESNECQHQCR